MKTMLGVCLMLTALPAVAQETISAERPGFSSSPFALDAGIWQVEGGYQYTQITNDAESHTLPLLLVRYGAGERTELQLSWSGYNQIDVGASSVDGVGDVNVGVKWQLSDDGATTPFGLFAGVSLPAGDNAFSSNEIDPTVGLFWAHNGRMSVFGTVLISEFDNQSTIANAVGLNLPMSRLCNSCSAYVEYFGLFSENSGPQHNANGGVSWLPAVNFQLDINLGIGINDRAPDGFLGFGAAYRF